MNIEYAKNRFVIECSFAENRLIDGLPSKRFDRRNRAWVAQNLRGNCQFLVDNLKEHLSPEIEIICSGTLAKTKVTYKPFPGMYDFKTQPFEQQRMALDFAYGLNRFAWFMEMGTGKTKCAIDLMTCHMEKGRIGGLIVFAPVNIRENWRREIKAHCPIDDIPVFILESGKKAQSIADEAVQWDNFIVIVGLESMQQKGTAYEAAITLSHGKYGVIVDESHNCKGHDANRAKNVGRLSANAEVMGIMTGTPTSQGFVDLYMQYEILDPNILGLGSYYAFRSRYCIMGGYEGKQITTYQNVDELIGLAKPFTFQATKAEFLDLPDKSYQVITVPMTKDQHKAYKDMDGAMHVQLTEDIEVYVEQMITKYGALQQIAGGFITVEDEPIEYEAKDGTIKFKRQRRPERLMPPGDNPKIKEVVRIAQEYPDRSIIIWCKYREEISMITKQLKAEFGNVVSEFHGGIPRDERMSIVDDFNSKETRFFVSNAATGGVGLNLVVADLVIFYSNSFRLVDRDQSEDRCHRIGQKSENVLYIDLFSELSHDAEVYDALRDKMDLADYLRRELTAASNT